MAPRTLEQRVAAVEIQHPRFVEILATLRERIDGVLLRGETPMVSWVIGPSRVGKTQIVRALARTYPPVLLPGGRTVPVAIAAPPTSTTTQLLPLGVLKALDAPYRLTNTTAGKLTSAMYDQLKLAQTRAIVFDEASQIVEPGSRIVPFAASEWFKQTANIAQVSQVLLGVARLARLIDANVQLKMRSHKRIDWLPYDVTQAADRDAYLTAVNTFLEVFREAGWTVDPPLEVITSNCYLHAPGLVGALSDLMKALARRLASQSPRSLGLDDFAGAANSLESCGLADMPAFTGKPVSLVDMNRAYRHLLSNNGLNA